MQIKQKALENFGIAVFPSENEWGIPHLLPQTANFSDFNLSADRQGGINWMSFHERKSTKNLVNTAIHLFNDDYKISTVWEDPSRYISLFRKAKAVVTPDFSMYTDMPKALQMYNVYRRQWCGRYWQECGVNVIPSLSWAEGQIEPWTFAGIPKNSVVALSVAGKNIDMQQEMADIQQILELLTPSKIFIKAEKRKANILKKMFDFEVIPCYAWKGGK
ncbi:MAG: DUF4417 domain-containing protein [Firmicutes bacterium]|nr:DUF4417 domain-containing protein [Bacillota bacterium]